MSPSFPKDNEPQTTPPSRLRRSWKRQTAQEALLFQLNVFFGTPPPAYHMVAKSFGLGRRRFEICTYLCLPSPPPLHKQICLGGLLCVHSTLQLIGRKGGWHIYAVTSSHYFTHIYVPPPQVAQFFVPKYVPKKEEALRR